jgi:hypothetical protein
VFEGYDAAGIVGIRQGSSNPKMPLPADVRGYPDAVAQALSQLRLVGVNGPYSVLLGANAFTALAETSDHGYPVLEHVKRLVDDKILWAPAIEGAFVLTTRGGDFDLRIGQDVSIGYSSHTETAVRLYLQETFTFLMLTSEAAVAMDGARGVQEEHHIRVERLARDVRGAEACRPGVNTFLERRARRGRAEIAESIRRGRTRAGNLHHGETEDTEREFDAAPLSGGARTRGSEHKPDGSATGLYSDPLALAPGPALPAGRVESRSHRVLRDLDDLCVRSVSVSSFPPW